MRRIHPSRKPIRNITCIAKRATSFAQISTGVHAPAIVDPRSTVEAGDVGVAPLHLRCDDLLQAVAGGCAACAVLDLLLDFGVGAGCLDVAFDGGGAGDAEGFEVRVAGACAVVADILVSMDVQSAESE